MAASWGRLKFMVEESTKYLVMLVVFLLTATGAQAQAPEPLPAAWVGSSTVRVMLSNGDVYQRHITSAAALLQPGPLYVGNFWNGAVANGQSSWGAIKNQYDDE